MYFYLKEPNTRKESLIYLIFYVKNDIHKNKNFKYSTGKKINPKEWDVASRYPKLKRGTSGKKNKHISLILDNYKNLLEATIKESEKNNTILTKAHLRTVFDDEFKYKGIQIQNQDKSLAYYIDLFITKKNSSKGQSISWNDKYNNLRNKIILFDTYNKFETKFSSINDDWLDTYCGFLRQLPTLLKNKTYKNRVEKFKIKLPKSPYNDNTLYRHINFLFTFLNWSQGKYHDINLDRLKNPVKEFQPEDVHLTIGEILSLENVKLDKPALIKVRDLFLIGIYSGQRFSDYSVFEKEDLVSTPQGDMIIKKSEKQEHHSFIPIHKKLKVLLDKYNWQMPKIASQNFNPHIQKICRKIGMTESVKTINYIGTKKNIEYKQKCDMVTSHTARRTFITISAEKGMPDHIIMKITGIKDSKTLEKYKKTNQKTVLFFGDKIWG